ncbi:hypothetical protein ACP275_14G133600, partial [Erythranthe tilingii]
MKAPEIQKQIVTGELLNTLLGVVHVLNTTSPCLEASLESLLTTFGYEFESLILKENKSAFYVHHFAHQLQLALVQITNKNKQLSEFFGSLELLDNIIGGSENNNDDLTRCGRASILLRNIVCFEFVFVLHLMRSILGITDELLQTLQKKDQDLASTMKL